MPFSSLPKFISISPPNYPNSIYKLNAAKRGGSVSVCVKCNGAAQGSAPAPGKKDGGSGNGNGNELYKDIAQLSNVIAADQHSDKSWNILCNIMEALQNSLMFTVQPTTKNGSMVGIKWRLGWQKPVMKWKNGVSIHSNHTYMGKLFIGNLETIIDPLLQLRPNAITLMKNWNWVPTKQRRVASLFLGFFLLLLSLFFFQFSVR